MQKNVIGILIVLSVIGLATYAFAQRGMGSGYMGWGPGTHWSGYGHNAGMNPFNEKQLELRAEFSENNPDPEKIATLQSELRNHRNGYGYGRHGGRNFNSRWGRGPGYCWR